MSPGVIGADIVKGIVYLEPTRRVAEVRVVTLERGEA